MIFIYIVIPAGKTDRTFCLQYGVRNMVFAIWCSRMVFVYGARAFVLGGLLKTEYNGNQPVRINIG
nr:hypothetical protein SUGSMm_07970 [Morganella morganii subsp. sibonii]